jgi:hypothetical protein
MSQELQESRSPDRFFVGRVDGKRTVFTLHSDHSICIASASPPVTVLEPAEKILSELVGLAA